jgi:hypothetical protein
MKIINEDVDDEQILKFIKPILKKNLVHMNNNVILTFKSIEIQIYDQDQNGKPKLLNPLFIQPKELKHLLNLSKKHLENSIIKSLIYNERNN